MDKKSLQALIGCFLIILVVMVIKPHSSRNETPVLEESTETARELVVDATPDVVSSPKQVDKPELKVIEDVVVPEETLSMPELISRIQNLLPKNGQLKFNSPADVHRTHPVILRAGLELGHLKEIWLKNASERKLAFDFYEQCTFDGSVIESVRALCYVNAIEVAVYLKKSDKVLAWTVDTSVQNLASRLMAGE